MHTNNKLVCEHVQTRVQEGSLTSTFSSDLPLRCVRFSLCVGILCVQHVQDISEQA